MTTLRKYVSKPVASDPKSGSAGTRAHKGSKTLQPPPSLSRVKVKLGSRRPPANLPPDQNSKQCSGTVLPSLLTVHWPLRFAQTRQQSTQPSGFVSVWNFKVVPMADLIFILEERGTAPPLQHVSHYKGWQFDVYLKPPVHRRPASRSDKRPEVKRLEKCPLSRTQPATLLPVFYLLHEQS